MGTMATAIGDYVRELSADRSQTVIADAAGLQRAHLSEIERGKIALPNADIRRRLAKALGVSHLDLLVAAGEITRAELGSVEGRVEVDPDDPRQALAARVGAALLDASDVTMFNLMLDNIEGRARRGREGRG